MIIIALIIQITGLTLLYQSWRKPHRHVVKNIIAWLVIMASLWSWQQEMGWEYGTSLWFLAIPLIAWVFTLKNREFRSQEAPQRLRKHIRPDKKRFTHAIIKVVIAGPLALMACFLCSSFISQILNHSLGLAQADHLILNLVLLLLLWPISIYWFIAKQVDWRPIAVLVTFTLSGSIWLYG